MTEHNQNEILFVTHFSAYSEEVPACRTILLRPGQVALNALMEHSSISFLTSSMRGMENTPKVFSCRAGFWVFATKLGTKEKVQ